MGGGLGGDEGGGSGGVEGKGGGGDMGGDGGGGDGGEQDRSPPWEAQLLQHEKSVPARARSLHARVLASHAARLPMPQQLQPPVTRLQVEPSAQPITLAMPVLKQVNVRGGEYGGGGGDLGASAGSGGGDGGGGAAGGEQDRVPP